MSTSHDKKIVHLGAECQIEPIKGSNVKVTIDGKEIGLVTSAELKAEAPALKPTDQQPGETRDRHFIRMFRGAFFGPNAMRNHMGRKAKKGKRK